MSEQPIQKPEEVAAFYSEMCIGAAKQMTGRTLDYSAESIALIESIIDQFRMDGAPTKNLSNTLVSMGCYLGEIFVRQQKGTWVWAADTPMKEVCAAPFLIQTGPTSFCNPIDKVSKRMENGEEDSLEFFYERFADCKIDKSAGSNWGFTAKKISWWRRLFRR
ncbi:MAG TPA: DUF3806 domain-containing protein [Rhodocyclaceae bacterium]|nr:DUF3806 domain-containing protein [Rhodocyclaceae bacterium]